jgi:predicted glutamine amidotransferase
VGARSTQLHWLQARQHPFGAARLADEDLSVDFAALTTPTDRVAVVATEPLTTGEPGGVSNRANCASSCTAANASLRAEHPREPAPVRARRIG